MKFWQYQTNLINGLAQALSRVRKVIGQLATGGGKTVIFSGITKSYIDNPANAGKSVVILVHRKKLLKQTRRSLYNMFKIDAQVIVAGMKHVPYSRVYVGMVETVERRIPLIHNIGMVIIDEAHIANFNKIHKHFASAFFIGFTATPLAASKKDPLKNYYDDIVVGPQIHELLAINREHPDKGLVQNVTFAPRDVVDRSQLEINSKGDFKDGQMSVAFSKPKYVKNTIEAYEKYAKGTKAIVFNVDIAHSTIVRDAFIGAGYDCRHIDSTMLDHEQEKIYNWFEHTPGAILCNVGVATTGVDVPSIETVIVNRATTSLALWLQMCGRGSRPYPGKIMFSIIDLGGNATIHGDWCVDRDWSDIFNNPPKPGDGKDNPAPSKYCPSCEALISASARTCHYCGYMFPLSVQAPEKEKAIDEFVIITKGVDVKALIEKNSNKKRYAAFYEIGRTIAKNATLTLPEITRESFEFMYNSYMELAKQWQAEHSKSISKWHYEEAKKHLIAELQKYYKEFTGEFARPDDIEAKKIILGDAKQILETGKDVVQEQHPQEKAAPPLRELQAAANAQKNDGDTLQQPQANGEHAQQVGTVVPVVAPLPDFNKFAEYFKL